MLFGRGCLDFVAVGEVIEERLQQIDDDEFVKFGGWGLDQRVHQFEILFAGPHVVFIQLQDRVFDVFCTEVEMGVEMKLAEEILRQGADIEFRIGRVVHQLPKIVRSEENKTFFVQVHLLLHVENKGDAAFQTEYQSVVPCQENRGDGTRVAHFQTDGKIRLIVRPVLKILM